ncbi:hypothetical protein ACH4U5_31060 [Streptomyces sp. NPDC020858]|uniref:hypothetical protein n=1 Tax=Streptomyces sp. NPDC020858 TaxID=3365097 RepID=UPI0037965D3D
MAEQEGHVMLTRTFLTTTTTKTPQDGNTSGTPDAKQVSDFITVQSFTNFAAMSGAVLGAWKAVQLTQWNGTDSRTVPFVLCLAFGLISVLMSKLSWREAGPAVFVALLNSLVLFGAVVGAAVGLKT